MTTASDPGASVTTKRASVLYPAWLRARARANAMRAPWLREAAQQIITDAAPWMTRTDDELWALMFGNTITRSWMVWSNGFCPACRASVPMYEWRMDALNVPWKTRCPHCDALFPTNDFAAFYQSGLDACGIFDATRADRALLFNTAHPDPADPLHLFGVDDGDGYRADDHCWRFISTYLIYGQWKQAVVAGIRQLGAAYLLTDDPAYAHKAAVLLDRVADLYPTFDFKEQGVMYEGPAHAGYVSTWHDACEETRQMVQAYDQIFDAVKDDAALVAFLADKARAVGLENPKASFADIQRNIEDRILRDAIANRHRIHSNYPRTEIALMTNALVLGWPENRDAVLAHLDEVLATSTAVDGVTGEKGLTGYSSFVIHGLAGFLERLARLEPTLLPELLERHPALGQTYRFHIDTWVGQQYYPLVGDCGAFAMRTTQYCGLSLSTRPGAGDSLPPDSMFSLLGRLTAHTGDPAYVQVCYHANGGQLDGLPYDLFAEDPAAFQRDMGAILAREGTEPRVGSVNKAAWHLAILRAGRGATSRALWIDYDNGGGHSHADAMNLGLFAHGLDLMPDFGYPPVQYGGWESPRAKWYTFTAAHNTVVVDGQNASRLWMPPQGGRTTLWADGEQIRAIRVSGPEILALPQFERTAALIDVSDEDSYVLDIFRVVGGTDHAKFQHSSFGGVTTAGLALQPGEAFDNECQMRDFRTDPAPAPGWSVEWQVEDRYGYLPAGADVRLRYTDLTVDASATLCEGWVIAGSFNTGEEAWIPRLLVRRRAAQGPLASTFVAVIEPHGGTPRLAGIRRLPLASADGHPCSDADVAVEITLADGRRDLCLARDAEDPLGRRRDGERVLVQPAWGVRLDGDFCHLRCAPDGRVLRLALGCARGVTVGALRVTLAREVDFLELDLSAAQPVVVRGDTEAIARIDTE